MPLCKRKLLVSTSIIAEGIIYEVPGKLLVFKKWSPLNQLTPLSHLAARISINQTKNATCLKSHFWVWLSYSATLPSWAQHSSSLGPKGFCLHPLASYQFWAKFCPKALQSSAGLSLQPTPDSTYSWSVRSNSGWPWTTNVSLRSK